MNPAQQAIAAFQTAYNVGFPADALTVDGIAGAKTQAAFKRAAAASIGEWVPKWEYGIRVDGDDICIDDVCITSFGGNGDGTIDDKQDNGNTASGRNTKSKRLYGVSLAMDSRKFPGMKERDPAGYAALLGAPLPRIEFGTKVEVEIDGVTFTPPDGVIDLGPGHDASQPGEPHGCDLTIPAAGVFEKGWSNHALAQSFFKRGNVRIIGAAKFLTR